MNLPHVRRASSPQKFSNPRSIAAAEIRSIFPGNFCNSGFNLHLRLCGRQVQRSVRKCCVELQSNSFKRAKGQAKCVYTMLPDMCHCTFGETSPSSTFLHTNFHQCVGHCCLFRSAVFCAISIHEPCPL